MSAGAGAPHVALGKNGLKVVTWTNAQGTSTDIFAVRVNAAGQVLDPDPLAIATGTRNDRDPAVASNGDTFLVAYTAPGSGIEAAVITSDGAEPLGPVV